MRLSFTFHFSHCILQLQHLFCSFFYDFYLVFALLTLFTDCFPDFNELSVFFVAHSVPENNYFKLFVRQPLELCFLGVIYGRVTVSLWCYHVSLTFHVSRSFTPMTVDFKAESLLPDSQTNFSGERPSPTGECEGTSCVRCGSPSTGAGVGWE